jgi:hypothetical protein
MSEYTAKDLSNRDLRGEDMTEQTLFETDLRGSKLYGIQVSMTCETWDGVKISQDQMAMLLLMISQADVEPRGGWRDGLQQLVEREVGEHEFRTLKRYLQLS